MANVGVDVEAGRVFVFRVGGAGRHRVDVDGEIAGAKVLDEVGPYSVFVARDGFDFNEVAVQPKEGALLAEVVGGGLRVMERPLLRRSKTGQEECY